MPELIRRWQSLELFTVNAGCHKIMWFVFFTVSGSQPQNIRLSVAVGPLDFTVVWYSRLKTVRGRRAAGTVVFCCQLYKTVRDKMTEMQQLNMSWIEVQFLRKAVDILCQCRQTLMYTYVFAYYLRKNNQSIIFEVPVTSVIVVIVIITRSLTFNQRRWIFIARPAALARTDVLTAMLHHQLR